MTRALILGAGGLAAIAWQTGLITGLADAGIDARNAEVFIGTSAGSCVAAQITSGLSLEMLFQRQAEPRLQTRESAPAIDSHLAAETAFALLDEKGAQESLRHIGAYALTASTVPDGEWRKVIAARLPIHTWPEREFLTVAVDAESGERRAFDHGSGVALVDAVAASCALPGIAAPVAIGGRHFMDGGLYSADNADLATGSDRILILAPAAGDPPFPAQPLESALRALREAGARVEVVRPDAATLAAMASAGSSLFDSTLRARAARAGREQGRGVAARQVAPSWG
jgi:NTE family protein